MSGPEHEQTQHVTALFNQGLALHQQGQFDEARLVYAQILARQPGHFDALYLSGVIASQGNQPELAVDLIGQAIAVNPNVGPAHCAHGNALLELSRCEEAISSYDRAIAINPAVAEVHYNRGIALRKMKRFEDAVASYDRAIAIRADYAQAHANRGNVLLDLQRHEEALASYDRAIAIMPAYADAHSNRGLALLELKHIAQSIASYDRAIAIRPDFVEAYWNKSLTLLTAGQLERGWELYEWRWKRDESLQHAGRSFKQPRWLGSGSLEGKTILLHAEQGLGDAIQFCRYARLVKAMGATVLLEVPKSLLDLFKGLQGVDGLIESGRELPAFDYHCPLLSLPWAFKTDLTTIPQSSPYLSSRADRRALWRERLGNKTKPRIGLAWSGNSAYKNDRNRSLPLAQVMQYLPEEFDYVSLQKDVRDEEKAILRKRAIAHYGDHLRDFADTAALCDLVDLVVSVDTSVAHLAGAMGKPTFVLLPYAADWRWLLDRTDSPWYESVTLYRQKNDKLWAPVLCQIASDLLKRRTVPGI
jgi:Tfp pilus assembly protein PilF